MIAQLSLALALASQDAAPELPAPPSTWLVLEAHDGAAPSLARCIDAYVAREAPNRPRPGDAGPGGLGLWREIGAAEAIEPGECALAFATLEAHEDRVVMARLSGAESFFLSGAGFTGDPERRGDVAVPIELRAGRNDLLVAGVRGALELSFELPRVRATVAPWASVSPLVNGRPDSWLFLDQVVAVWNSSTRWVGQLHINYGAAIPATPEAQTWTGQWQCEGRVAPLALAVRGVPFWTDDGVTRIDASELLWPVEVWDDGPQGSNDPSAIGRYLFRVPVRPDLEQARNPSLLRGDAVAGRIGPALDLDPLFLLPDSGEAVEHYAALDLARFLQERLAYETGMIAEIVERADLWTGLTNLSVDHDVVLFGNATIQSLWSMAGFEKSGARIARGELEAAGEGRGGDELAALYVRPGPPPDSPKKGTIGFVGFSGPVGARRLFAELRFRGGAASDGPWIAPPIDGGG